jgi:heavy metal sensor kinase
MKTKLRSIGIRLTLWYAAAFATSLLLLGVAMWFAVQQGLYHAIDESLRDRADGIRIFIEDHKTRLFLDEVKEEFRAHGDLFQVLDEQGQWIHRAEGLQDLGTPGGAQLDLDPRFEDRTLGGAPVRLLSTNLEVDGHVYTVQVAAPLRDLQQGLRDALWLLAPLFPAVLLLGSAGGYWISRRALAPVDEITRTARSITADNLSERLTVPATGDELQRLSETLNEMIARLEFAFKRIIRFTADASHELRTPLAVMRTTAEVALRGNHADEERRDALEQIVAEIQRTSHLVDNLLLIANADAGHGRPDKVRMNLTDAVAEACTEGAVLARSKGVALQAQIPDEPIWVLGDAHALRRLFLILVDNAVKYTPAGGRCEVSVDERDGFVIGTVSDTGIGIAGEDLPHIFDRFYRVDRARSRAQGGTGLGLAIGRWIAEAHEASITVESELDRGSVFEVRLRRA